MKNKNFEKALIEEMKKYSVINELRAFADGVNFALREVEKSI